MLAALIERDGGTVIHPGIISDNPESILEALQDDADIIIVSGFKCWTGKITHLV